jgi:hypothetical protein
MYYASGLGQTNEMRNVELLDPYAVMPSAADLPGCIPGELRAEAQAACAARSLHGPAGALGDAASEYQARYRDYLAELRNWERAAADYRRAVDAAEERAQAIARWDAEHVAYQRAHLGWQRQVEEYEAALRSWQARRQAYDGAWATYQLALAQWQRCDIAQRERYNQRIAQAEYAYPGEDAGVGFSCQSAALQQRYAAECAAHRGQYVRGWSLQGPLGQVASTNACFRAELPVCEAACVHPGSAPAIPNPGPAPPAPPPEPAAPRGSRPRPLQVPAPPGPKPEPPLPPEGGRMTSTALEMPSCIPAAYQQEAIDMCRQLSLTGLIGIGALPEPYSLDPCAAAALPVCESTTDLATQRSSLMVGGILLLLLLGGGYAIYRSQKT